MNAPSNLEINTIAQDFQSLRQCYDSGLTRPLAWRRAQLQQLKNCLSENEAIFRAALKADLAKCEFESWGSEIGFLESEIKLALKNLSNWAKPRKVSTPLIAKPAKSLIVPEPKGVVLIIGAWNYPVHLTLGPLIAAIAAGNCAVIKPSEVAPASSQAMAELVPKYLDTNAIRVCEGAVPETTRLLEQPFDHIFYTGGESVAKIVMTAAAKHLTPVTLELGGKSPCIVASDAELDTAAARIVWSKFINAGQTCVAPDYLLVEARNLEPVVEALDKKMKAFYGDNPATSDDYGRIINQKHTERIAAYLDGQNVKIGGDVDIDQKYIAPTIIINPDAQSPVMQEEIFGPILPIVTLERIDDAIPFINERSKPLALYLYTKDDDLEERVLSGTSAGSVAVNDGMMFMTNPNLPFGGVGNSGMGRYHGQFGFDTFSHLKAVIKRGTWPDPSLRYPPFGRLKLALMKRLL